MNYTSFISHDNAGDTLGNVEKVIEIVE